MHEIFNLYWLCHQKYIFLFYALLYISYLQVYLCRKINNVNKQYDTSWICIDGMINWIWLMVRNHDIRINVTQLQIVQILMIPIRISQ